MKKSIVFVGTIEGDRIVNTKNSTKCLPFMSGTFVITQNENILYGADWIVYRHVRSDYTIVNPKFLGSQVEVEKAQAFMGSHASYQVI